MPKKILVYVCDHDSDGTPILALATSTAELPEDCNGQTVGSYDLIAERKFVVTKDLK